VPRALVIDDDSAIRAALSRFFTRRGWVCHEAEHGRAALDQLAESSAYDVLVCDLRMPVMSGVELHDYLAASSPELLDRLLLIAGNVTSPEVAEFLERTSCPLLTKPFELHELASAVEELQGRTRQI
jgi:CheY-like chemotaxis protein